MHERTARRTLSGARGLVLALGLVAAGAVGAGEPAPAKGGAMTPSVYDFRMQTIDGAERSLADYRGKALLIVNTASQCGFTPQYQSLETLYERYRARGFEILAFPANNFLWQEPGSNADIKKFCSGRYKTTFPLFAKIDVRGKKIAPLYAYLTKASAHPGPIPWNFTKFIVAPDGRVVARFDPQVDPLAADVTRAVEQVLPAR